MQTPTPDSDIQVFRSRVDWWLVAIVFVPMALACWGSARALYDSRSTDNWVAVGISWSVSALVTWLFVSTAYEVGPTDLVIRAGPLRESVPIASIRRIAPSRSLLASPALSLRRMELTYGKYDSAIVSPKDEAGFVAALQARNPNIETTR